MSVNVNLTDANTHSVALYFLDWDNAGRAERVDVLDVSTHAVLDTRTISAFQTGEYLVWNLTGSVTFRITLTGGPNAVLSGIFFGTQAAVPTQAAATFIENDPVTQGTWKGVYGSDGEAIYTDSVNYPLYAMSELSSRTRQLCGSSVDERCTGSSDGGIDRPNCASVVCNFEPERRHESHGRE